MTAFKLRTALPDDAADVAALTSISYAALMPSAYDHGRLQTILPIICRANPRLLASGRYFLAIADDCRVIGAGGWSREQPGTGELLPKTGHIRHFATHPDWTGRGIGRAIHRRCAAEAGAAGLDRLECFASLNAVDFYERLGFNSLRPTTVSLGEDVSMPVMLMEQRL